MTKTILLFIALAGMLSVGSATSCSDFDTEIECSKRGCKWTHRPYGEKGHRGFCSGNIRDGDGEKHPKASPTDAVSDSIESSPTRSRYLRDGKRDGSFEGAY
mmetsp:Transcript_8394/g.16987  ORF Transcript_8394/g.16987 Transcript_8394/m.16987 type:complete len:102 (-) Transcript_8394:112-417(-)